MRIAEEFSSSPKLLEWVEKNISYKPRFTFYWSFNEIYDVTFRIVASVQDSFHPENKQLIPVIGVYHFSWNTIRQWNIEYFLEKVFKYILDFETHEAGEWFKVSGTPFHNPHSGEEWNSSLSLDQPSKA